MESNDYAKPRIAVVIPCFRVKDKVLGVIEAIGPEVDSIICVDDACPENSGEFIREQTRDPRVVVLQHEKNQGVGGATLTGYAYALSQHPDIIVKIDGDGQMNPELIPVFVDPIVRGDADYTKGSRFTRPDDLKRMPRIRLFGNSLLSLIAKLSTGYWRHLDPTNGYTAVHGSVLSKLPLNRMSRRYVFETDLLFQLRIIDACVWDIPMTARYEDEKSSLIWFEVAPLFLLRHIRNSVVRIFYLYVVRDFNLAILQLAAGIPLFLFGMIFGLVKWRQSFTTGATASAGSVMLAALPILVGIQLMLSFLNYDMSSAPARPISRFGPKRTKRG
jgi:glycosyltransferase involved in cell wall biosynthesis